MTVKMITVIAVVLLGTWAYGDECNSLRYVDNGNGTVTDCRTGLVWLKNASCMVASNGVPNPVGMLNWQNAMKWVAGLGNGLCSLTDGSAAGDWRLPTKYEWMMMLEAARKLLLSNPAFINPTFTNAAGTGQWTTGDYFTGIATDGIYWSATSNAALPDYAGYAYLYNGLVSNAPKSELMYVWPVRGGQAGTIGTLRVE